MEENKLHTIFKYRRMSRKMMKVPDAELGDIMVAYKYLPSTGAIFLNHSKELKKLDTDKLNQILNEQCTCQGSTFCYGPAGHIVTGDLNLITNEKLRVLFEYGTKYRIPTTINWQDVESTCSDAVANLMLKIANKFKIRPDLLDPCMKKCMDIVISRIRQCRKHASADDKHSSSMGGAQWICLRQLKKKFIIAPADKAGNNYIFICKKFYLQALCKEMGVTQDTGGLWKATGNAVYQQTHQTIQQLIVKQSSSSS